MTREILELLKYKSIRFVESLLGFNAIALVLTFFVWFMCAFIEWDFTIEFGWLTVRVIEAICLFFAFCYTCNEGDDDYDDDYDDDDEYIRGISEFGY